MKITNKHNLPEGIVKAVTNDSYDKGDCHYSISQLIMPPQMLRLMQLHWNELTTDVSEEIWKLFGSSVHYILDQANQETKQLSASEQRKALESVIDYTTKYTGGDPSTASDEEVMLAFNGIRKNVEKKDVAQNQLVNIEGRLYGSIGGVRISGKPDWYHTLAKQIEDYKVTQVYKVMKGDHSDWESQGNSYAWLLRENGEDPRTFKINAILKDWKVSEAKRNEEYPQAPVEVVNISLWNPLKQVRFLLDRIEKHEALKSVVFPEELFSTVPCSDKEKWHGNDSFAVKKKGGSRAVNGGIFPTIEEANQFLITKGTDHYVEKRIGANKRCEEYCIVKNFCAQRKYDIGEKDGHATVSIEPKHEIEQWTEPEIAKLTENPLPAIDLTKVNGMLEKTIIASSSEVDALNKISKSDAEPIKPNSALDGFLKDLEKKDKPKVETTAEVVAKYDKLAEDARKKVEKDNSTEPLTLDLGLAIEKKEEEAPETDSALLTDINNILGSI